MYKWIQKMFARCDSSPFCVLNFTSHAVFF